jgi:beta-lactamase superfamily II metal-dependent hydrolase
MLTITFKNVAHGDTIILEWLNDEGQNEIGIIDCHLRNGKSNLTVEHIQNQGYKKINFMILTHPHTDHFSGFPSLLEFCKVQGIKIGRFWHTADYHKSLLEELVHNKIIGGKITVDDFLDSFVSRIGDKNTLKKLFKEIVALKGSQTLNEIGIVNDTSRLKLNKKLWIEFLSPSYAELKEYYKGIFNLDPEEKMKIRRRQNNPKANLLSLFTRIFTPDWSVLLPSDSTKSTIERIAKDCQKRLDTKVAALQIPNHGRLQSHFEPLWENIPGKENVPVFVSVGWEYGLPAREVIDFFDKNYKEVHATNFVGGFKEYFDEAYNPKAKKGMIIDTLVDMHDSSNDYCGEKQIKISEDGTYHVFTNP